MSHKTNGVNWNKSSQAKQRRKKVIERLENQLQSGKSNGVQSDASSISRINRELETLKTRI